MGLSGEVCMECWSKWFLCWLWVICVWVDGFIFGVSGRQL